ncbi:MAG: tyrosine-type recombinase/integrase [Rhizobiales bacterium]|nr:tyrosine-type recombinase/integrase [Hyphomicrobiales bacterium]
MVATTLRPGSTKRWVFLDVPEGVDIPSGRFDRDGKPILIKRFAASTGETDLGRAKAVAAKIEADWRRQIQDARDGITRRQEDHERAAMELYERLRQAKTADERAAIVREIDLEHGVLAMNTDRDFSSDGSGPHPAADQFRGLATGELVPVERNVEAYLKSKAGSREAKTLDQARAIIKRFAGEFEYTRDVTRRGVQEYVNGLAVDNASQQTIRRLVSQLRTYWRYLQSLEIVADGLTPFDGLQRQDGGKAERARKRQAFTPKDVSRLIAEARRSREDEQLADAVTILAHTGMRLDELASMKLEQVRQGCFHIKEDSDGKTEAATRIVPVHSAIVGLVKRLCRASKDGYLISGLSSKNKYKKRGISLSDKFGRLKKAMGFDKRYVLHSIRHTVTTLLIQAGVDQVVRYEILGHEHERLEERVYGHGVSLKQKRAAIEKLKYPRS